MERIALPPRNRDEPRRAGGGMTGFGPAVEALARHASRPLSWQPSFQPLVAVEGAGPSFATPVLAVDGSHAVLADNGAVWVVAHRASALAWPGPAPPVDPVVTAAT